MIDPNARPLAAPDLSRAVGWSVMILAAIALTGVIVVARVFLIPVILTLLLALIFSPLCRTLRRRGIPEQVSAGVIVFLLLAGVVTASATLALPVSGWIDDAPRLALEVERKLTDVIGATEAMREASESIEDLGDTSKNDGDDPIEVVVQQSGPLSVVAFGAPLIAAQTAFVLILLYFILASGSLFYERLVRVLPNFSDKKRAITIAYDIEREVSRYLFSITLINAGLGVAVTIAFVLLGMPNPVIFGILAFALNFVPFIGAIIGTALSFAVALVSMDMVGDAFLVSLIFWGLTAIEGQFVTPMLVGRQLRLNTVVILISVAFWAWLWSIMGMLMAVPLLVTFRVFCRHIPQLFAVEEFLSGRDPDDADPSKG